MKKSIIIVSLIILIFIVIIAIDDSPNLGFFTEIPKEIDGGSCIYYSDKKGSDNYVFVNDYGNYGYAVIDDIGEVFKLKNYETETST